MNDINVMDKLADLAKETVVKMKDIGVVEDIHSNIQLTAAFKYFGEQLTTITSGDTSFEVTDNFGKGIKLLVEEIKSEIPEYTQPHGEDKLLAKNVAINMVQSIVTSDAKTTMAQRDTLIQIASGFDLIANTARKLAQTM